ncbi:NCS2 family permease [bacterium]|nr:NCS2 family permease [bacterium]
MSLDSYFGISSNKTNMRVEVLGGMTTFITMAYIIVVNPAILAGAGFPIPASTVATILAAIFGTLLMGVYARRPIAVAPYMGENAFIAFGMLAIGLNVTVEQRLTVVLLSGVAFLILTLLKLRIWLAESISTSLKHSFAVGIGLFLAFLGLYETGIVQNFVAGNPAAMFLDSSGEMLTNPSVPIKIGDITNGQVLLSIATFFVMIVLIQCKIRGAILIGIVLSAAAGISLGYGNMPTEFVALPFTGEYTVAPIAMKFDFAGVLNMAFLPVLLTLFLMGFLDTLGTLVGLGAAADMLDEKGNFPEIQKPMMVDALSCIFAPLVGTSTSGAYIESATGIRDGARTGIASIVTAGFFAISLFFLPMISSLASLQFAYAPALIVVGIMMVGAIRHIDFDDLTELAPACVTIGMMVFTYNIANGLTAGLVVWPALKLATGRWHEIRPGAWALGAMCLAYYVFGIPH